MIRLFSTKAGEVARTRKSGRAAVEVEGLEDRALMTAGFNLADTLNARDTIDIQRLNVVQQIEQLRLVNSSQLQQVIANGQDQTNALVVQYTNLLAQENADRLAGDTAAVAADRLAERQTLVQIKGIRVLMQQATRTANTVDSTLARDENNVNRTFNNTQRNLSRGNNPFLTVPHAVNALNVYGAQAQQHADKGTVILSSINDQILSVLTPLTPVD